MNIRSITRTAAIIYADEQLTRKTETIKRRFVESVFINNNNSLLTIAELITNIEEDMGLLFSEEEKDGLEIAEANGWKCFRTGDEELTPEALVAALKEA